jgi:hypothetical protein
LEKSSRLPAAGAEPVTVVEPPLEAAVRSVGGPGAGDVEIRIPRPALSWMELVEIETRSWNWSETLTPSPLL